MVICGERRKSHTGRIAVEKLDNSQPHRKCLAINANGVNAYSLRLHLTCGGLCAISLINGFFYVICSLALGVHMYVNELTPHRYTHTHTLIQSGTWLKALAVNVHN